MADDRYLDRLLAAGREARADTSAQEEYFEVRLMARIAERKSSAPPWYLLLWRMVPGFALLAVLTAVISLAFNNSSQVGDLFAGITSGQEERLLLSSLAGVKP